MTQPPKPRDVRMRGFAARSTVEAAWQWVDAQPAPLPAESIDLAAAHGRVLSEPVVSSVDVPGFDRSAMDGYAVRGSETIGAGDYNTISLTLIGESLPGRPFRGDVQPGQAVRIMTGAPLPRGADAVVPAEYAAESARQVRISAGAAPLKNVGRIGEDIRAGTQVLAAGRLLRPQDVAVIASLGLGRIRVVQRPRVRIVVTGDELALPGSPKGDYEIYEANSFQLVGLVTRDGGLLESLRRVPDRRDEIRTALSEPGADVILVSGGSSVGAEDHAPTLLAELGELAIHGVAMRPSSPAGMGRIETAAVFLLPGNPVSCLSAYDFFAGRLIRRLGGRNGDWPYRTMRAPLAQKIASAIGRMDYCRVRVIDGRIEPLALSGASILSSTTRADGFVVVPAEYEGYPPGAEVSVFLYDP